MMLTVKINKSTLENGDAQKVLSEIKEYLSNNEKKDFKKELTVYLERNNLRKTIERYAILEKIINENDPFCVDAIHTKVNRDLLVSSTTIRNSFKLFIDIGIIRRLNENEKNELFNTTYFELT